MSGTGFEELRDWADRNGLVIYNGLTNRDGRLTLWHIQAEPSHCLLTGAQLRQFLAEHPNEERIVMMYDFLPKITPWAVVVGTQWDVIVQLLNAISRLRYPLTRLHAILAGESRDPGPRDLIRRGHLSGDLPPQLEYIGAPVREENEFERRGWLRDARRDPSNPYTKPGANTFVMNRSDGAFGIIYDSENKPEPLQILKCVLAVMDGVGAARNLSDRFRDVLPDSEVPQPGDISGVVDRYWESLNDEERMPHYRFGFKRGRVLK